MKEICGHSQCRLEHVIAQMLGGLLVLEEGAEDADGIGAAAHAGDHRILKARDWDFAAHAIVCS